MTPFLSSQASTQQNTPNEECLTHILEQQQHCLEQIIQLLKAENAAILERNIKLIDNYLDKKLMLLSQLEQLDKQRQNYFEQQTGISYSHSNFAHFIKQHPSDAVQNVWQLIKVMLPECKTQNEVNGKMISIRKENTDQVLQILLGRPQNSTPTYSHLGQTNLQKRNALYTAV
jgi:flagellar biosynthesis/type III secretory pathway chaperone